MKVAVILTGHCRDFDKTFDTFKNSIFDKYNTDVYFNTWDVNQSSVNREVNGHFNLPNRYVDTSILLEKLKPYLKNYNFESWENYEKNRFPNISFLDRPDDVFKTNERAIYHGSFWVERLRDQWWMVQRAWKLIPNPYEYDVIYRVRFDMLIHYIQFKKAKFVVPKSEVEFHKIGTNWSDHMAYGEPDSMEKYCNMFDHIETIYKDYNIDISHAEAMSEFYMNQYGIKSESFVDFDIKYEKAR
jgi:hypothetical protein